MKPSLRNSGIRTELLEQSFCAQTGETWPFLGGRVLNAAGRDQEGDTAGNLQEARKTTF